MGKRKPEIAAPALRSHVEPFSGEWRHLEWCRKHGFRATVDKTIEETAAEQAA